MTAPSRESQEFEPVYHHYGPHRAGLPPLVPYFRELWHRRGFAAEMSKASMRGANTSTFFGQAWLIINPLLLAGVYYLLVTILRGKHEPVLFAHLTLGLFAFNLIATAASTGATSVTGSGKLLINTAFPRLLIPLAAVRTAFFRFLPTVPVYLIFHIILLPTVWSPVQLLSDPAQPARPAHPDCTEGALQRRRQDLRVRRRARPLPPAVAGRGSGDGALRPHGPGAGQDPRRGQPAGPADHLRFRDQRPGSRRGALPHPQDRYRATIPERSGAARGARSERMRCLYGPWQTIHRLPRVTEFRATHEAVLS
jgi:hypothetical protein